ncbi:hypothetical protein ABPG75_013595 [Micractinium tetrahymenae]
MPKAVGIDLGTTYSCVGSWERDAQRVRILENDSGNPTTLSVVAFTDEERLVGEAARNQGVQNPVGGAPRGGVFEKNPAVQADLSRLPFRVQASNDDTPLIEVRYRGEQKQLTPEEVSAMVLGHLQGIASRGLGEEVRQAVITVPAYFTDAQRQATKDAGAIAGLEVLRIINEPTAAAIAYGLDKASQELEEALSVLIFDLGGGTFDVSLLSMESGIIEVKATAGDTHLGGSDFDTRLVNYCAEEFERRTGLDLGGNARALRRLRTECEAAKCALSFATSADIELPHLFEGHGLFLTISRAKFEELCGDLFQQCVGVVAHVLRDARVLREEVHDIVLVGGSTRIPRVQQMLQDFFNGKELCKSINPDEAVAYGAAVQAAILTGDTDECTDILLLDVTPLSLGIGTADGTVSRIVKRHSTIPVQQDKDFTTSTDNQTALGIPIYEGERAKREDNSKLGEFRLEGMLPAPRGAAKVDVTFSIDANGILNVSAKDTATGRSSDITIRNTGRLSAADVERMVSEAAQYRAEDEEVKKNAAARHKLEDYLYSIKHSLEDESIASRLAGTAAEHVKDLVLAAINWSQANQLMPAQRYEERQREVEAVAAPIFAAFYSAGGAPLPGAGATGGRLPGGLGRGGMPGLPPGVGAGALGALGATAGMAGLGASGAGPSMGRRGAGGMGAMADIAQLMSSMGRAGGGAAGAGGAAGLGGLGGMADIAQLMASTGMGGLGGGMGTGVEEMDLGGEAEEYEAKEPAEEAQEEEEEEEAVDADLSGAELAGAELAVGEAEPDFGAGLVSATKAAEEAGAGLASPEAVLARSDDGGMGAAAAGGDEESGASEVEERDEEAHHMAHTATGAGWLGGLAGLSLAEAGIEAEAGDADMAMAELETVLMGTGLAGALGGFGFGSSGKGVKQAGADEGPDMAGSEVQAGVEMAGAEEDIGAGLAGKAAEPGVDADTDLPAGSGEGRPEAEPEAEEETALPEEDLPATAGGGLEGLGGPPPAAELEGKAAGGMAVRGGDTAEAVVLGAGAAGTAPDE